MRVQHLIVTARGSVGKLARFCPGKIVPSQPHNGDNSAPTTVFRKAKHHQTETGIRHKLNKSKQKHNTSNAHAHIEHQR
jgi:hypothetical protein